ncbi:MAG: hypothetical protein ACKUBY_03955 [Candidatus Moraniibacteriota bacterium]|jgi:hypothetical protein
MSTDNKEVSNNGQIEGISDGDNNENNIEQTEPINIDVDEPKLGDTPDSRLIQELEKGMKKG